ncbi:hypothetical protein [Streptomyces plumbiresistens]|uniref:hypothetical protein n=1 Tax=Streptomyces plumbiresistens TaxID=511811 RepID=UPI0031EBCB8F
MTASTAANPMPKVTVSAALAWPFAVLPGFGDDMGEEPGSAAAAVIMPGGTMCWFSTQLVFRPPSGPRWLRRP